MNIHAKNTHAEAASAAAKIFPEEWEARVDLAAVYRLVAHYGWDDVIYNHCSMRVPGEQIEPPGPIVKDAQKSFIRGIAKLPDRLVYMMDLEGILPPSVHAPEEADDLEQADAA